MSEAYEHLLVETSEAVTTITLNRPHAANGMHIPLCSELLRAAIAAAEDDSVRCVVVTGAGKMFSAGGDLKAMAGFGERIGDGLSELTAYLHSAISRLARMNKPLVIAVNGTAAGAGMSLAAIGDIVIAAKSAKFTMAYTAAGLTPDGSSTFFLPRILGMRKTQELMLTNRLLSAEEAADWGLVTQVVDDDSVMETAMQAAKRLAAGPTRAFGTVKDLLAQSFSNGLETQLEEEARGIVKQSSTSDGREGIAAFLEKRKPEFRGK
jgi:2-(1,2-epoxy-1,2-dihydrophenyl)acetyl-CoA isomerase